MRTLALVPARAGSKGVPGKNARMFAGKPLLAWAVEVGKATCDEVWVTTDAPEYGIIGAQYGAGVIVRPRELAQDDTPMLPVVRHALQSFEDEGFSWRPDVVVLLQPTSPLRTNEQVQIALRMLEHGNADSVVSVVPIPRHMSPYWAARVVDGSLEHLYGEPAGRRQDLSEAYYRDGTVYAIRRRTIEEGSLYGHRCYPLMLRAEESVTIDSEADFARAEQMLMASV